MPDGPDDAFFADAPEVDFAPRLLRAMARGDVADLGRGVLADLEALDQPHACASGRCAPGRRAAGARSCCADLEVVPTEDERAAILAALPSLDRGEPGLPDERWAEGPPEPFEADGALRRPGRRCVFARRTAAGLRCALQTADPALKPWSCRLFPLALLRLPDGGTVLTAVHRRTASLLGTRPARAFPCLGAPSDPPLVESERATITTLVGRRGYAKLVAALAGRRVG